MLSYGNVSHYYLKDYQTRLQRIKDAMCLFDFKLFSLLNETLPQVTLHRDLINVDVFSISVSG